MTTLTPCPTCGTPCRLVQHGIDENDEPVRHYELVPSEELERLRAELADIHDQHRRVMSEKCPTDEVHCTCVPVLRREVERLERALRKADKNAEALAEMWISSSRVEEKP